MKMKMNKLNNFLKGIGSILNIFPSTNYKTKHLNKTQEERILGYWNETNKHFKNIMVKIDKKV